MAGAEYKSGSLEIRFPNMKQIRKELKKTEKNVEATIQKAIKDTASRTPAQVTKAVTAEYNIKSGEVTAAGKAAKAGRNVVGKIKVSGITAESILLTYSGRVLTPVHFSMTPKKRPEGNRKYTVKVAIHKGKKKKLNGEYGTGSFLAPSGAAGTTDIPFERLTAARSPIEAIRSTSIPQMIENPTVSKEIKKSVADVLMDRIAHYTERALKKQE